MIEFTLNTNASSKRAGVLESWFAEAKTLRLTRIVGDHDPKWGYKTLEGYLNEDVCQALDQIIDEVLSFAHNPADRWKQADEGIHILAAGLYSLLRHDGWQVDGGSIEQWLGAAEAHVRLAPAVLHRAAAEIMGRAPEHL
jgi:hypothetical protein